MSKINVNVCDICNNIVDDVIAVYVNGYVYELCSNCYNKIESLEDMKHIHKAVISEIDKMINKKVEKIKNERKEDII